MSSGIINRLDLVPEDDMQFLGCQRLMLEDSMGL